MGKLGAEDPTVRFAYEVVLVSGVRLTSPMTVPAEHGVEEVPAIVADATTQKATDPVGGPVQAGQLLSVTSDVKVMLWGGVTCCEAGLTDNAVVVKAAPLLPPPVLDPEMHVDWLAPSGLKIFTIWLFPVSAA